MQYSMCHTIICQADQLSVYKLIKDSKQWPNLFEPCKEVIILESGDNFEHIQISALVNEVEMSWTSRREFLDDICAINTTVVQPIPLLKSMNVKWRIAPVDFNESIILLQHDFEVKEDVAGYVPRVNNKAAAIQYMRAAIENNSIRELQNISEIIKKRQIKTKWVVKHAIKCDSVAYETYMLLKNIALWPSIYNTCKSVDIINSRENVEDIAIQADLGGRMQSWVTRRTYHDANYTIDFTLPKPMPLLKSMHGTWIVAPIDLQSSVIYVERYFELLNDVDGIIDGIHTTADAYNYFVNFTNTNARIELQALKNYLDKAV